MRGGPSIPLTFPHGTTQATESLGAGPSVEDPENRESSVLSCTQDSKQVERVSWPLPLPSMPQSPPTPKSRRVQVRVGRVPCLHLDPAPLFTKPQASGKRVGTRKGRPDLPNSPSSMTPGVSEQKAASCGLIQAPLAPSSSRGIVGKGPLLRNLSTILFSIIQAAATSDLGEGSSKLLTPSQERWGGEWSPSPCSSHSRAPSTIKQKRTQAAPTSGAWPQGGGRGVSQRLPGTDGLEGGEDRSHQLPRHPHSTSRRLPPSPIKQKRIQQH